MRMSDWSSDVCPSDLGQDRRAQRADEINACVKRPLLGKRIEPAAVGAGDFRVAGHRHGERQALGQDHQLAPAAELAFQVVHVLVDPVGVAQRRDGDAGLAEMEEHTSELQSLMRISYAVFCLKKKTSEEHMI